MAMGSIARQEYLAELRKHYLGAGKREKGALLDTAVVLTGMHRKALVRSLRSPLLKPKPTVLPVVGKRRGPQVRYDAAFHDALLVCWQTVNGICAERLQPFLPELVSKLEACDELAVTAETRALLLTASISTVARHLQAERRRSTIPLGTTKPGSLLKSDIAVRYGRWEETVPGWLESDTVAHGGDSAAGQFIHTYNFVDIATGWSEQVASLGKGERATVQGFDDVRRRFPFAILGIDSDNGSEYINNHLRRYCEREKLTFTRSRPYKKNDNAHVEQKNWEAVRKMVGYARLETHEHLELLGELYGGPLRLYLNYFQPNRKHKARETDTATGRAKKYYFEAKTPYQRVREHPDVPQVTKDRLQAEYDRLNPAELRTQVGNMIERLKRSVG